MGCHNSGGKYVKLSYRFWKTDRVFWCVIRMLLYTEAHLHVLFIIHWRIMCQIVLLFAAIFLSFTRKSNLESKFSLNKIPPHPFTKRFVPRDKTEAAMCDVKRRSAIGQDIVSPCTDWPTYRHHITVRLFYGLF